MTTSFKSVETRFAAWQSQQPLSPENERRLWQKLRLEWNYHSNHIEGNTLTYGETELYLIHGQTHGNHSIREYVEMQAHDVGIAHLRELAEDQSRFLSESDIRNLNKIILKEPFWKPAQTADGQATRKQIIPGEYKTTPNNVLTATGELFEFAAPADVPAKMQALVQWMEKAVASDEESILSVLAKLHHDFVLIHPFDDGNGRVARMLVNYVLMRLEYPPIIVPTERKKDYLAALRLADAGEITELETFLGQCVIRSLELGIKAAKGESLEEPGDIEKEIKLFIQSQDKHKEKVKQPSTDLIRELSETSFKRLFSQCHERMGVFQELFVKSSISIEPKSPESGDDLNKAFVHFLKKGFRMNQRFVMRFNYDGFRGEAPKPFGVGAVITLKFDKFEYVLSIGSREIFRKLYTEPMMSEEINQFVDTVQKDVFNDIKKKAKKSG